MLFVPLAFFAVAANGVSLNTKKTEVTAEVATTSTSNKFIKDEKYITTPLAFDTQLRICNAYPFAKEGIQVFDETIQYGTCVDLERAIHAREQIDFFTSQKQVLVGSFEVGTVPQQNTMLMMVVQAHDTQSTGVSFQSHAFANVNDPQIALLDAYVGEKKVSLVNIHDDTEPERAEKLRLGSVVAVHPGNYDIGLSKESSRYVNAGSQEKISVIRIGAGNKEFPEGLIVFPSSGAASVTAMSALVMLAGFFML